MILLIPIAKLLLTANPIPIHLSLVRLANTPACSAPESFQDDLLRIIERVAPHKLLEEEGSWFERELEKDRIGQKGG